MNFRLVSTPVLSALILGLALSAAAAQDANSAPQDNQGPGMGQGMGQDGSPGGGGGYGRRGGMGAMGGMMGRGVEGTVTAVAADRFTVKTFNGETYTVQFSANTHFMKQPAGMRGEGGRGQGQEGTRGQGGGWRGQGGGNAALAIKASDIKVGDAIAAMGEPDTAAKSVGAMGVLLLDPERAKQMEQMAEDYGKTWLMGKVTAVNGTQVTLQGSVDNAPHAFVADENTDFRERRNPITLADIHVGDMVRAEGSLKGGAFTATTVNVVNMPAEGMRPQRNSPPPQ